MLLAPFNAGADFLDDVFLTFLLIAMVGAW